MKFKNYTDYTAEQLFGGTAIAEDTETQNLINERFHFREACDDDEHFLYYFRRDINRYYPRYLLLVADELASIPDLVDYKETIINQKETNNNLSDTISKIVEKIKANTESIVREAIDNDTYSGSDRLTGTTQDDETYSADDDLSKSNTKLNTGSKTNEQLTDGKRIVVDKGGSNTIKYSGASAGVVPALDWDVVGGQHQEALNDGKSKVTDDLSEVDSGSENRDISSTGQKVTTHNTTDAKSGSHNSTLNDETSKTLDGSENITDSESKARAQKVLEGELKKKKIMSKFETELRDNIWQYIRKHEAIGWLYGVLENDFMQVRL